MDNTLSAELQQRLAELQEIFHQQLPGKIDEIRHTWATLEAAWDEPSLTLLHRMSHSLAGSAGTFGAHEVGLAARALEQHLKPFLHGAAPSTQQDQPELAGLVETLIACAENWAPQRAPQAPQQGEEHSIEENAREGLIYIVEDDLNVATQYEQLLSSYGYQVEIFTSTEAFIRACQLAHPAVTIMDMVFSEGPTAGVQAIEQLSDSQECCTDVIFISERKDIKARLAALRAGARHYLTKPVEMEQLLMRVDRLTGQSHAQPYRILIVDDDDTLAQYYSEILESHGIETRIINNPLMTLEVIEEYQPELLLLDIYMEECSGTELAAVIRQDDRLAMMPIIFLSEELDEGHQLAALHLGGDDFITKPVDPDFLIDKVSARLERARSIRDLHDQLRHTMRELEYQQLALNAHAIVSTTDPDGNIIYVNDRFCQVSQYSRAELLGKNHRIVNSGQHPREFFTSMWETISRGKVWHGVMQNRAKDGSYYWVESTIVPFLDKQGVPYKYVAIRTDISPVIRVQRVIEAARDQAEAANRAKSRFLSSMSHELRTPLNSVLGFAQLLEQGPLNEQQRNWVRDILKGGNHLLQLLSDTLDLARIEAGQVETTLAPVSIEEVLAETASLFRTQLESRHIDCSWDDCDKRVVRADRNHLKQVLHNLLSNAIKYNREGGTIHIRCDRGQKKQMLRLAISDSGPGIATARIPELFEPFNRLGAESGTIEGSGIGLTICRDLVERMGGEIGVDSEPGHGSTFWIELPLDPSTAVQAAIHTGQPLSPGEADGRKFNVIYIEDNPLNLRLVSMIMATLPHIRLETADEPLLGLELIHNHLPDLVLLDINLPGMSGYDVLSKLRQSEKTAQIPVIAVTANAQESDLRKGRESGFDAYITKPINLPEFIRTINETLRGPEGGNTL